MAPNKDGESSGEEGSSLEDKHDEDTTDDEVIQDPPAGANAKTPPKPQNNEGPPKKKQRYTRNHDVTCEGEFTLPDGKLAIKYSVIMHDTKDLKRSDTTYVGHVTAREWQDSRNALLALGGSLKPWKKVLKAGEWEDYSAYLQQKHEEWEQGQTSEMNKRCVYLSEPSFEFVDEKLYFITGTKSVWNLEVAPFGEKLSEEQIKDLPFVILFSGNEEEFNYDPEALLKEMALSLKNLNEAQMYRGEGVAPSSKFLNACPAILNSMLKGYLYGPATQRGLMATLTWALSGKEFSCGKSWSMLNGAHLIFGPNEDDIKAIKVSAESTTSGIWEHADSHKILVVDEMELKPEFIATMGSLVDNKFNNCSRKINGKVYSPQAGVLVMGNYLKEDILKLTKGRGKTPVLEPKTDSKMEYLMIGNKRINHPNTTDLRAESLRAAGRAHKFWPMMLAVKWQSMFKTKEIGQEEWDKVQGFTNNDRATTNIMEFMAFTQKLKDLMIEFKVDLPPCLDQPDVDLNIHRYFFQNKGRDPEEFIVYLLESNKCHLIEMGTHKSAHGIKLRLKDFTDDQDWYRYISEADHFVTSFKGHKTKRLQFIPCDTVSDGTMNKLKGQCFSVANAIEDDLLSAESDIKSCLKSIVEAIKRNVPGSEDQEIEMAVEKNGTRKEERKGVRRSYRKTVNQIWKEEMEKITELLRRESDEDLGLKVQLFPDKGRGVVTTIDRERGEYVVEYKGDLIDIESASQRETQYAMDVSKGSFMFFFEHQARRYCIDATIETSRMGRLLNHSYKHPNLIPKVMLVDGSPRLYLIARHAIKADTELVYDYGDRDKATIKANPWLAQ